MTGQYLCWSTKSWVLKVEKQCTDNRFREAGWEWDSLVQYLQLHKSPWALIFATSKKQTLTLQVSLHSMFFTQIT